MVIADLHLLQTHLTTLEVGVGIVALFMLAVLLILLVGEKRSGKPGNKAGRRRRSRRWLMGLGLIGFVGVVLLAIVGVVLLDVPVALLPFQRVVDIPLPGGSSRFDYQSLDQRTGLLFITHSGANMVTVFDTVSRKVVADIPGIKDPHDVAVASDLGRVFVTSATDNLVAVIDAHSHAIVARIPVGEAPDGLIYDPADQKLFVADEAGQNDAVIDARSERRIAEIPLGGHAGDVEYDALSHHILAVVATLNQLVTIDAVSDQIIARSDLVGCQTAQDLVLDESQHLAFVDCIDNATLVMVDLQSMKVLSTQSTGKSPDLMALDTGWHYLYIAGESGFVSVFDEHGGMLRKMAEGFVAKGAHSVAVNQQTHYIYFPLEDINGKPVLKVALLQRP